MNTITRTFTAATLAIALVGSTVSSFTFVTEAQAFGLSSIKKSVKKTAKKTTSALQKADKKIRKAGKSTKDFIACNHCPTGKWIDLDVVTPTGKIGDLPAGTKGNPSHDHRS